MDGVLGAPSSGWDGGERSRVDGHVAYGGRAAREQRHLLLPVLHAVQERVGWISPGALDYVCARLTVPPADAYGVASFYALLSTRAARRRRSSTSATTSSAARGAEELRSQMDRRRTGRRAAPGCAAPASASARRARRR